MKRRKGRTKEEEEEVQDDVYDINSSAPQPTQEGDDQWYEPFGPASELESDPDLRPQIILEDTRLLVRQTPRILAPSGSRLIGFRVGILRISYLLGGSVCLLVTCVDCGTSKTPLWRDGPAGPKSSSLKKYLVELTWRVRHPEFQKFTIVDAWETRLYIVPRTLSTMPFRDKIAAGIPFEDKGCETDNGGHET
ncbi:hypothetical protein FXO38_06400 [Capsicum annuum]|nr:hypothetical protein FXO38_06400 [Capsicum annuum]KAF3674350.1 hypothetical protein FXO37_06451 [Capsicum annuum]